MLQHFQFNWETIGYKGNTAVGEIKQWDCFNDSPTRKVRSTVNWVSLHSDLSITAYCKCFFLFFFCSVIISFCEIPSKHPVEYICWHPAGHSMSIPISRINSFVFQTAMVQEFHFFLWQCGSMWCTLFAQQPVIPNTLARWAHATSQAASCTSSCCNKCATVLRTALYCWGMQTLAPGCSLHSSTHSSFSQQKCLSVLEGFNQVQMHLKMQNICKSILHHICVLHWSQTAVCTMCAWIQTVQTLKWGLTRPDYLYYWLYWLIN